MQENRNKIKVIHFQRKPRPGANYSIESIFENLRCRLKDKIDFSVNACSYYNDGYFSKFLNIVEAASRQKKNAIAHITGEVHFLDLFMRKKNVLLTIHDCRFMERKSGMAKKLMAWLYLKAPVYKTKFVTAVSENTKKDIINYTGVSAEKICVIHDNVDSIFKPVPKIFNYTCPVILQIGTAPNKNLSRLTDAVKSISCKLVIIGSPGERELEKLAENKIAYVIKSNLSADELYIEYVNSDIVAFVSTFEGFGMPIVEANCVERAVLTSNISSMPEVAGDAACLVDPYDTEDIRKGLLKLIHNKEYREQLIANGRKNKLRFDGKIIAEQYYQLYKKIAENF